MEKWFKIGPMVLFCGYFVKLCILGAGWEAVLALGVMAAFVLIQQYTFKDKKIQELKEEVSELRSELQIVRKDIESVRSFITSQKLGGIRVNSSAR